MEDLVANWAQNTHKRFHRMVEFLGALCREVVCDLRNWRRFRWRDMLYYLALCGQKSVSIVLLICFLMGMVLALQVGYIVLVTVLGMLRISQSDWVSNIGAIIKILILAVIVVFCLKIAIIFAEILIEITLLY